MPRQVTLSPLAQSDIEDVLYWTRKHFGEIQRRRYSALIQFALRKLRASSSDVYLRPRATINPDARIFHLSCIGQRVSHFFVLRILADDNLEIGRLLHDSMDLPSHLPEEYRP
jgi:toxin ParE1/3/4